MEGKSLTFVLGQGWCGQKIYKDRIFSNVVLLNPSPRHRFFQAYCKRRPRSFSSQGRRQQGKKLYRSRPTYENIRANGDEESDSESPSKAHSPNLEGSDDDPSTSLKAVQSDEKEINSLLNEITSLSINGDEKEKFPSVHIQDLVGMIRNAERNIHLLNNARVRALEDLDKILGEKKALKGEINTLQAKLAETDERIKVAAQEKIHMEVLEDQLEKLNEKLLDRDDHLVNMHDVQNSVPATQNSGSDSLNKELDLLRTENLSLKNDLHVLKEELNNIKRTDERVHILEEERSALEASLKELESKLVASQNDVSKLSSLVSECKILNDKVEHLQALLDKSTMQADQAVLVVEQNQELQKKVAKLEESLEEANVYKLSAERLQQQNESMQQKIKLLDERLQKSDEEIHSYVQLYQDSVQEFQETLHNLKNKSKIGVLDQPVDDMPLAFWSRLLVMIDGWFLEKKISEDHARLLRELTRKRDARICETFMTFKEKKESEILAAFLGLTVSPISSGLHVIHIAAEMAPVAKVGGLGDVVTGLGRALQKNGHLVEIIIPKYDCLRHELVDDLTALDVMIESYFDGQLYKNKLWTGIVEGLPVYFIEPLHPNKFFWRGQFYGENDDFKRFSFFSRAALELLLQTGKRPDIIHCHDWQTAFVAPLYWEIYSPKGLNSSRICFTCHNFEYQGIAPASELASCGLDVHHLNRPDRMQDNSAHDRVNPIKGAIVFSNIVTTVSPTYAQEVLRAEVCSYSWLDN
ncbi:hypothetical protein LIER_34299 [Lithospermum erythrorhizon]|uniref:starch synthase n=1 Tax=Lithospermum erythrorhizon TaxID=34254 RepID=A0AAV3RZ38_LITER